MASSNSTDYYKDYYDLLGLSRDDDNLTPEKIKKAFIVKAMIWHPDKAPAEDAKPLYTKMYEELQKAYKTLSNEDSRRQYSDSRQLTNIELVRQDRGDTVGYERAAQYMVVTERGISFDRDTFISDFESKRDTADKKLIDKAEAVQSRVTTNDYQKFIAERDSSIEINNVFNVTNSTMNFDPALFNKAFEYVKKNNPSQGLGLEEYIAEPSAMGLAEIDNIHTGVNFESNISLGKGSYNGLDVGVAFNPKSLDLSKIQSFKTAEQEQTMTASDAQSKLEALQKMRGDGIDPENRVWSSQNI